MKKLSVLLIVLLGAGIFVSANAETCPSSSRFQYSQGGYAYYDDWYIYTRSIHGDVIKLDSFAGAEAPFGFGTAQSIYCNYNVTFANDFKGKATAISVRRISKAIKVTGWKMAIGGRAVCNSSSPGDCPFEVIIHNH